MVTEVFGIVLCYRHGRCVWFVCVSVCVRILRCVVRYASYVCSCVCVCVCYVLFCHVMSCDVMLCYGLMHTAYVQVLGGSVIRFHGCECIYGSEQFFALV